MTGKNHRIMKSEWQTSMEEWQQGVDQQLAMIFAALNDIDATNENLDSRLVNTNKQVTKLMGIKE